MTRCNNIYVREEAEEEHWGVSTESAQLWYMLLWTTAGQIWSKGWYFMPKQPLFEYWYIGAVKVEWDYRSCVLLTFQNLKLGSYIWKSKKKNLEVMLDDT